MVQVLMSRELTLTEEATQDLRERTLAALPNSLSKLVYLASLRDYNTGQYHHAGLSESFGDRAATEAMEECHMEAFLDLALRPIEGLFHELDAYVHCYGDMAEDVMDTWEKLSAYTVVVPVNCDPITRQIFVSNVRCVLEVLKGLPDAGKENRLPS